MIKKYSVIIILLSLVVMQTLLRVPFLNEPLERDEGCYGYIAQRIIAGEVPYRDVFDHKPPAIYFVYAGIIKTFGPSVIAIRDFTLLYSIITMLAMFILGQLLWGTKAGLLTAFFFALFSHGPFIQGSNANTEVFMILPMVLALIFYLKAESNKKPWWFFAAGVFSGLAILFKQVAALNFLVLLVFVALEGLGSLTFLVLGALLFPLVTLSYFAFNHALIEFFNCVIVANINYINNSPTKGFLVNPLYGLGIMLRTFIYENGILYLLSSAALVIILIKDWQRKNILIFLWAIASFGGVALGRFFFPHYFVQGLPALVMLSAYGLLKLINSSLIRNLRFVVCFMLVLGFVLFSALKVQMQFYTANPQKVSEIKYAGEADFYLSQKIAMELKAELKPKETVFAWPANPEIYFYLGQKSPIYYPVVLGWLGKNNLNKIIDEIKLQKPTYVVWDSSTEAFYPPMVDFILTKYYFYREYKNKSKSKVNFVVFKVKPAAGKSNH